MILSNSRTLVVGCGFVGRQLAQELRQVGASVWGLSRTLRELPPGVNGVAADITDVATLHERLPIGITHVVFAASAGGSSDEQYKAVYVSGSSNVLASLDRSSLQRVVFVSSTAVYAQEHGEWVDEDSPAVPTHFSGQRMLEAEHLIAASGTSNVVLRCAGIYGPGRTRLIDTVRHGNASYDPVTPRFTNRIHRNDVALAIAHLMCHPDPARVYVGVDEYPAPEREVFEFLASRLGVDGPKPNDGRESTRSASNKRCSSERLRKHGYSFRFPTFRDGYGAMLMPGQPLEP